MSITKEEICEKFDYSTAQNVKHEVFEEYHVRQRVSLLAQARSNQSINSELAKLLKNLINYLHKAKYLKKWWL